MRYQSAHGLKTDLIECQRRLLAMVSSSSEDSSEVCQKTREFIINSDYLMKAYTVLRNSTRGPIYGLCYLAELNF